ncbi:MAG: phosphoheptose isomerase [Candidatus Niyogibacteria bacterium CG10_big_fil_rev_8_21_14_0_10_46_36]|uniref:Phosphoheptose isomerase n=1 Tax=Candidatus Niyogibacteria bacterium CG10_big_fil_rev_8_21_14_0_10_46_36 TaxID=1974726 RepID=A0A2H0TGK4_9BACT|nr:MAG: phosphoheptose isomerase [Candidatus Niyogibacteria bacterium CG10_big_fil_rev_8_21_14_0_10_46_36]
MLLLLNMDKSSIETFLAHMNNGITNASFTDAHGNAFPYDKALGEIAALFKHTADTEKKLIFVGNGGSAAIASHMAQDYTKIGGIRAVCFNDPSLMSCFGNDYSFEDMFAKAIEFYADQGDTVIAISSSGSSKNIINAAKTAKVNGCAVVTLSGFDKKNPLFALGTLNIHIPTQTYGTTETAHGLFLHAILDHLADNLPHN